MRTNAWGDPIHYNSVKQIIRYLDKNPFKTEREIREDVFGGGPDKKYADMIRRALVKGTIRRTEVEGQRYRFIYYT